MIKPQELKILKNKFTNDNYQLTTNDISELFDTILYLVENFKNTEEKYRNSLKSELVGYCKECGSKIGETDSMEYLDYENIYECPCCYHPHLKDEMLKQKEGFKNV